MLKKTLGTALVAFWAFVPVVSTGQEVPPGRWWRLPEVTKHLELNDQEKDQLNDLFVNSRRKLIDLKSDLERERFDLENLLESEPLNEKAVMEQFKELEKARSHLANERFRSFLEARKILGLERFQQLKMLFRKFKKGRHFGKRRGLDEGGPFPPPE